MIAPQTVVLIDAVRSPFTPVDGGLAHLHPVQLGADTTVGLQSRTGFPAEVVQTVLWGCAQAVGGQSHNLARNVVCTLGWGQATGFTIDTSSYGGLETVTLAAGMVRQSSGLVVVGAVEHSSNVPPGSCTIRTKLGSPYGPAMEQKFAGDGGLLPPGPQAERLAATLKIDRYRLETFSRRTRRAGQMAAEKGWFEPEVVVGGSVVADVISTEVPAEMLSKETRPDGASPTFQPLFGAEGVLSAESVAAPADGAVAAVVATATVAHRLGLKVRASIVGVETAGADITALTKATRQLLGSPPVRALGVDLNAVDVIEVDETFAVRPVAWAEQLGVELDRINRNGGALALGDAAGASGLRLLLAAVNQMERIDGRYGLVVAGSGMGAAAVLLARF